jgi:multicomponent Na+:H+ antiporter subunit F
MTAHDFMQYCLVIGLALNTLSIAIAFVRIWRGPVLVDRVVAIDTMTTRIIVFCALFTVQVGGEAYLDIAVALALVGFVSVVGLARFAERLARREKQ